MHRASLLLAMILLASIVHAGDLRDLRGDEPLKSAINAAEGSVRILFLGAPT